MNINELRGITNLNFEPEKFIGEDEDEDMLYMNEFNSSAARRRKKNPSSKRAAKYQQYGDINNPVYMSP